MTSAHNDRWRRIAGIPTVAGARDLRWLVGLAVGIVAFWEWRVVVDADALIFECIDYFYYFWPAQAYQAVRLRQGELPFWNPYQGAGHPFLAMLQPGALYPARALLLVASVPTAMHISALLHVVLGCGAMFLLCRRLGACAIGALVGAVIFMIAFSLMQLYRPSWHEPGAWMPVLVLLFVGLARAPHGRSAMALGVGGAMPILAGGYQMALYEVYALLIVGIAMLLQPERRQGIVTRRSAWCLLGAVVIAASLSAPQWMTTLEWTTETLRHMSRHLTDVQLDQLRVTPATILSGTLLRQETTALLYGLPYLSMPVALLAIVGFIAAGRFGWTLGASAVALYLLALGPQTPWFWAYRWIPGFGLFRRPRALLALVVFLCAVGAALGVSAIARMVASTRPGLARPVALTCLAIVVWLLVVPYENPSMFPWTAPPHGRRAMNGDSELWSLVEANVGQQRAILPGNLGPNAFSLLNRQGSLRQLRVVQDYEPLASRRLGIYLQAMQAGEIRDLTTDESYAGTIKLDGITPQPNLLDALAARVVVARMSPLLEDGEVMTRIDDFTNPSVGVWINQRALPRAYLRTRARFVADEETALATMLASDFDLAREVIAVRESHGAGDDQSLVTALADARLPPDSRSPLVPAIVADEPEEVVVDFSTDRPAVLVLADQHAPGWTVTIDGKPRPLWRANYLFRGVLVRPGERRARFHYSPPRFATGVAVAALALGAALLVVGLDRRRARRPSES